MDPAILGRTEFPAASRPQWLAKVAKTLGKDEAYESLVSRTDDGIAIDPLAEREATAPAVLPRAHANQPWGIIQRVDDTDPARANRQARQDIAQGATGLAIVFAGAPNAFGRGLPPTQKAILAALDDVPLKDMQLRLDVHPLSRASIDWLVELLTVRRADPSRMSLSFGIDPSAIFAGTGRLRMSIEALEASLPQSLAGFFAMDLPSILMEADGRTFHNAGATEAQELGIMLASAVSHLRMFEEARQPLVYAAPHIGFAISVDQDQFLSIAKIRALRTLWTRVLEACSVEPMPTTVHAETSYRMLTARDAETNLLRNTIAAFAAATGGADTISVLPHTIACGLPDAFARRLARNTQLLLADESHLDFVSDPTSGAGGIETLTEALCAEAWEEFRRIEAEGGTLRSLGAGHIQKRILESRNKRREEYVSGKRAIIGTTLYPPAEDRPVQTLEASAEPVPAEGVVSCEPLAAVRIDEGLGEAKA